MNTACTSRPDLAQAIVDLSEGVLHLLDLGTGWPSTVQVSVGPDAIQAHLYVGIIGDSGRNREDERRFQNPGQNHPISAPPGGVALLLGISFGQNDTEPPILVAMDAYRRMGQDTRFSMFVPQTLLVQAAESGYVEHRSSSAETLHAFEPKNLRRYLEDLLSHTNFAQSARITVSPYPRDQQCHSAGAEYAIGAMEHDNSKRKGNVMAKVDQPQDVDATALAQLLGLSSVAELAQRLRSALSAQPDVAPTNVQETMRALICRETPSEAHPPVAPRAALLAVATLDPRIRVMLGIWSRLGLPGEPPLAHELFVRHIFEDQRFLGRQPHGQYEAMVIDIASKCEPNLEPEDNEIFFDQGSPSLFFYEMVASQLERPSPSPRQLSLDVLDQNLSGENGDDPFAEDDEEDPEDEHDSEPVRAQVKPFQVESLYNLVYRGRLEIQPPWQRKDVWSLRRKRELIRSLIVGIPLPSIILHKGGNSYSIIDGKQRLTAIMQFLQNEWKLPNDFVKPGSPFESCRGAYCQKEGKKSLPDEIRTDLNLREIPALVFEDVDEPRLRKIFQLYNVTGTKLNAAEIRNAVYQSNDIHRMAYTLAGEGDSTIDLDIGGVEVQKRFAQKLRATYPNAQSRYQGVDFLERYLGYSRAAARPRPNDHLTQETFSLPSTSAAINNYLDFVSPGEDHKAVGRELIAVFDAAERFFTINDERLAFFVRNKVGKKRQFSKLLATTHMVAARFLLEVIRLGHRTEQDAAAAAEAVNVEIPDKQQRATIWDYQARLLIGLRNELSINEGMLSQEWRDFFHKMTYCLIPDEGNR